MGNMVNGVANISDGVVVGSAILKAVDSLDENATTEQKANAIRDVTSDLAKGLKQSKDATNQAKKLGQIPDEWKENDENKSRFGKFGGQYIPETLSVAFEEIEEAFNKVKDDKEFNDELEYYRREFVGGPTPLHKAE